MSLALLLAALLATLQAQRTQATLAGNCYQWGEGGWDLMWWGDPHVRLPSGGIIPVCGTGSGYVIFRWKDPQGVFQIPSDRCPSSFSPPFNDTFQELAPVSDSNHMGFFWLPPQEPGPYWVTSQAPGACEAGKHAVRRKGLLRRDCRDASSPFGGEEPGGTDKHRGFTIGSRCDA
ncbi:hypothetical protein ABPG77_005103 [Micractinium sp. CCAP 211/92]